MTHGSDMDDSGNDWTEDVLGAGFLNGGVQAGERADVNHAPNIG